MDTDFECLENIEPLIKNEDCIISLEPELHCKIFNRDRILSCALMGSVQNHFYKKSYR